MALTAGRKFYGRLTTAIENRDLRALETLYRPDAIRISANTREVFRGRAAILADIAETCDIAGPIKPVSLECFVEYADAIAVESTQSSRAGTEQVYDWFVLRDGAVSHHISGQITQRRPEMPQGFPNTPAAQFYQHVVRRMERLDYVGLAALYRPDAVAVSSSFGVVRQGREAIVDSVRQEYRWGGPSLQTLTSFVEGADAACAEGVLSRKISTRPTKSAATIQLLVADAVIVRGGGIRYQFGCLIQPRPDELRAQLLEHEKALHDLEMSALADVRRRAANLLGPNYWR